MKAEDRKASLVPKSPKSQGTLFRILSFTGEKSVRFMHCVDECG